jgi:hypothetical protein
MSKYHCNLHIRSKHFGENVATEHKLSPTDRPGLNVWPHVETGYRSRILQSNRIFDVSRIVDTYMHSQGLPQVFAW